MALAEQRLAAEFNTDELAVIDHRTIVIVGDGCSYGRHLPRGRFTCRYPRAGQLVGLYDDNGISIDGEVGEWFGEDVPARFEAYGWRVIRNVDGHDATTLPRLLRTRPTIPGSRRSFCLRTTIGYGSPAKAGTADAHGSPLGDDEIAVCVAS